MLGDSSRSNSRLASSTSPAASLTEAEQPVQALRRIPLPPVGLEILNNSSLAQHGLRAFERSTRDVDHRALEVRERKFRVELKRARQGIQALRAPGGVRETKMVAPGRWLEAHRAVGFVLRFCRTAGTHEQECQGRARFGDIPIDLDRPAGVSDRTCQQRRVGMIAGARQLVGEEACVGEPDVRDAYPSSIEIACLK